MNTTTLGDQAAAITACSVLASRYAHLPAADLDIGIVVAPHAITTGIKVHLHDALDAFEAWREALDISPDSLTLKHLSIGVTLSAWTLVCGIPVHLIGYGRPPTATPTAAVA